MSDERTVTGGCHCGGVRFRATGPLFGVINCHCSDCRRLHGHYNPMVGAPKAGVELLSEDTLTWYDSSDRARRGFCSRCGGRLFHEVHGAGRLMISAGTLDAPTGFTTTKDIFVGEKGDYYEVPAR